MTLTRLIKRFLLVVVLFATCKTGIAGQWVDMRVGGADGAPTVALQGTNRVGDNLYSAGFRFGSHLIDRYYREFSVGVGRHYTHRFGATALQAGLGVFEIEDRDLKPRLKPAVPVSATFILGKYLGLSGTLYANINSIKPFIGFEIGVVLGKFR